MQSQQRPKNYWLSSFINLAISLVLIAAAMWVIMNRQVIVDHLSVWQNQPSEEVVQLAERSGMSQRGKFLFYASVPEISDRQTFIDQCGSRSEKTAILGCYSAQRIYIFDVEDQRLDGIKEVTAAHEMLHAAYERMSSRERKSLDTLVEQAYQSIQNERLEGLLDYYEQAEPGHRYNELHAIIGTEYGEIPQELEDHYEQFFDDRSLVVGLAQNYQQTFDMLEGMQQSLVSELNALASEIESRSNSYSLSVEQLSRAIVDFNRRADRGQFTSQFEFDNQRAELLAQQSSLASEQRAIERLIGRYDNKRQELDEINLTVEDINHSINASLPETPDI